MRKDIKELQQRLGMTVVYVTHDQAEAMSMADIVVLMDAGGIEQDGTPDDLYYRPANTFVAEFIGTPPMALIDAAARRASSVPKGGHPRRERRGGGPARPACAAGSSECEFLGAETLSSASATRRRPGSPSACQGSARSLVGEELEITFADDDLHFFDATGRRMNDTAAPRAAGAMHASLKNRHRKGRKR